jgi:hypothetical protein
MVALPAGRRRPHDDVDAADARRLSTAARAAPPRSDSTPIAAQISVDGRFGTCAGGGVDGSGWAGRACAAPAAGF